MPVIAFQDRLLPSRIGVRRTFLLAALVLAGCDRPSDLPPAPATPTPAPLAADELVVLVRPGPATYFDGPQGAPAGLDADLAHLFAARTHRRLRMVPMDSAAKLLDAIAQGKGSLGAGNFYRPASPPPKRLPGDAAPSAPGTEPAVLWSTGYYAVEPVLIYNAEGFKPSGWRDLSGQPVGYMASTGLDAELAELRTTHPEVRWTAMDVPTGDALIAQVSDGQLDHAIVGSNLVAAARDIYLGFDVAFPVGSRRELAWVLPPGATALRDEIDTFFAQLKRDGTLKRLVDRYFNRARQVPRIDAGVLHERIRTVLPQFRAAFEHAQQDTGIEWRLLAAVAYQESQWDPLATSETGVRGMMQITEETARHLGMLDRLDPEASILAAARYLRGLKQKLPQRIEEPDRTWLALAAFNIGLGHLEDARVLAQKQKLNPDSWSDVKKALPLLAEPEFYEQSKLGYARGGMPVAFVDRVRAYYDVLLARQPRYQPRLQVARER